MLLAGQRDTAGQRTVGVISWTAGQALVGVISVISWTAGQALGCY